MKKWIVALISCSLTGIVLPAHSQPNSGAPEPKLVGKMPAVAPDIRLEPANWWVGMKHNQVEILVHARDIATYSAKLGPAKGVKLVKIEKSDSPNYLFLTLDIQNKAKPQKVPLIFSKGPNVMTQPFPLLARDSEPRAQGVDSRDVIYLLMPDRFANGDPSNDNVPGMYQGLQRDSSLGRHGGDLKGVRDHLDYMQDLGVSTLWMNPELENDQEKESYHGYALTDHYRVDRRFGTNEQLRDLIRDCHQRKMKVIRDVVINHIGNHHYWMTDLPAKDWIHQWPAFTRTTYRAPTLMDPYASANDRKLFSDGWFDVTMPDLNQQNPHLANYLIQQAIWWVEYAGFDALRIDTYTYSDQTFMSRWCREVREEYPNLSLFGEIWDHGVMIQGFFAENQPMRRAGFNSNLPGVIDFQWMFAVQEALTRDQGWTEGAARVYYTMVQDYFSQDPMRNLIMLDNHVFTRFFTTIGENFDKYRSGMALLLTMRGVPQIYYMTEILGAGNSYPTHGNIRKDFPGGWPGDPQNKFTPKGRTPKEQEAYEYARTLIRYRNRTTSHQTGKMTQFVPSDGVYVYFRYDASATVMVVVNTSGKPVDLQTTRFQECMHGFSKAKDIAANTVLTDLSTLHIAPNSPLVLELVP